MRPRRTWLADACTGSALMSRAEPALFGAAGAAGAGAAAPGDGVGDAVGAGVAGAVSVAGAGVGAGLAGSGFLPRTSPAFLRRSPPTWASAGVEDTMVARA